MSKRTELLAIAADDLGYCRFDDPKHGTKYGRWYAQKMGNSYFGTNGVPFCAMAVSYWLAKAGVTCAGFPSAYVPDIVTAAKKKGKVRSNKKSAKPGDVITFDWDGGLADHVGLVEKVYDTYVQCIEANTTGADGRSGSVARRTRDWSKVECVIIPNYPTTTEVWQIEEDGIWGEDTTALAQEVEDIIASGKVYNQPTSNKGCFAEGQCWCFVFKKSPKAGGSLLIKRIQNDCGTPWKDCDGYFGPNTTKAFIKKWVDNPNYFKKLLLPSIAVKNYQKYLNKQAKAKNITR